MPAQPDNRFDLTATPPVRLMPDPLDPNHSEESEFDVEDPQEAYDAVGLTDVGRKRKNNQDQFLIAELSKSMRVGSTSLPLEQRLYGRARGQVMVVADGMGGHAGGERASELAIGYLVSRVLDTIHWHFHGDAEEHAFVASLQKMLQDTHTRILVESAQDASIRGMGTTLTMAYVLWPTMYVVHAGDSRCYVVDKQAARQLTKDHTMARRMVESGGLKPEDEATSRWSNVLWNVLGGSNDGDIIADVGRTDLKTGDWVVLCSDGLHRYVDTDKLHEVMMSDTTIKQKCQTLVDLALDAGGEDNVTVVVYRSPERGMNNSTWIEDFKLQLGTNLDSMDDIQLSSPTTVVHPDSDDLSDDFLSETLPEVL